MAKEELMEKIERSREMLDQSIEQKQEAGLIYRLSVDLDFLIEQYIVAGF